MARASQAGTSPGNPVNAVAGRYWPSPIRTNAPEVHCTGTSVASTAIPTDSAPASGRARIGMSGVPSVRIADSRCDPVHR